MFPRFRRSHPFLLATTTIALVSACSAMFAGASMGGGGMAAAPSGPSHPPATAAQWAHDEQVAHDLARDAGASSFGAPIRINARGPVAMQHIDVLGGHCYHFGVAWSFDAMLSFGVSYDDGTNQSLAGKNQRFQGSSGSLEFCADRKGGATLTFGAVPRSGAMVNGELLEYAVAVGSSIESNGARVARHTLERKQAQTAKEQQAALDALGKQHDADALERRCRDCHRTYEQCSSGDCRRDFFVCSNENDFSKADGSTRPCGAP